MTRSTSTPSSEEGGRGGGGREVGGRLFAAQGGLGQHSMREGEGEGKQRGGGRWLSGCVVLYQRSTSTPSSEHTAAAHTGSPPPPPLMSLPACASAPSPSPLHPPPTTHTRRSLCSFTHPLVNGATFSSLAALKRRLLEQHKLHFCDLCIKGRKVRGGVYRVQASSTELGGFGNHTVVWQQRAVQGPDSIAPLAAAAAACLPNKLLQNKPCTTRCLSVNRCCTHAASRLTSPLLVLLFVCHPPPQNPQPLGVYQ